MKVDETKKLLLCVKKSTKKNKKIVKNKNTKIKKTRKYDEKEKKFKYLLQIQCNTMK